ncbi:MAG TPA: P22 phage major capsid protein family protein [Gemmatimonadaceae bacterium]|nr:P22 phage major capsid protein family protein [Gemmatimonadaceae bacterium]
MDTFITPTFVTKDTAIHWKNRLKLAASFDRSYNDAFKSTPGGGKVGYTVNVRTPQRFTVAEGQAIQLQNILNQTVPITINHQQHVAMGWSSADDTLLVEEVQSRYTKPAGEALASKVDVTAGAEVYRSVYNSIGTPGERLTDSQVFMDAIAKLGTLGVPEPYIAVVDGKTQASIVGANLALFNLPGGAEMFKTGQFSSGAFGIDEWILDPNMPTHVTGTFTSSSWAVNGAGQTGSSLAVDGAGTYALKAGDVFTIDGVYAVNPISYADSGELQQFVVTADLSGSSSGTLSISPSIIPSGQLQTVTNSPANDAAITFLGSTGTTSATMAAQRSKQSLIFNPEAFALVTADLKENLAGARTKRISSKTAGVSMRWVEQYAITTDQNPSRMDILYGVAAVAPHFAIRAWS